VDHYFATHVQQVRIIDYLNRDVKRAFIVTTSANQQTVTLTIPKYIIQSGDAEAVSNPSLVGAMRSPTLSTTTSLVNYGDDYKHRSLLNQRCLYFAHRRWRLLRTVASSTDSLVPKDSDTELTNTEIYNYVGHVFLPIFTSGECRRRTHRNNRLFSRLSPEISDADKFMKVSSIPNERRETSLLCAICTIFIISLIAAKRAAELHRPL